MKKPFAMTLIAAALMVAGAAQAKEVTDADIPTMPRPPVTSASASAQGQRFSPLDKVNVKTVKNLVPAWSFSFGGEKQRGQESQPVIHDGKMFVTASYSRLFALDAKTGKKLWKYEHRLPDGIMPCCDVINRGAALYGNLVIFATLDAQLVALNKDTGKVVWKEKIDDYAAGYSATAAPLIAKGKVITGVSGGEFGVVGRMEARDAKTGKLVWTRPTVEGHMGYKWVNGEKVENGISGTTNATWTGDLWKTGGAATWNGATYDPETNLIFAGTGNPAPGTATCAPATTCSRPPPWPSTRTPARSSGTTRPPPRRLGLRRRERIRFLRLQGPEDRQGHQGRRQGRPQRLLLRARPYQRQAAQRLPVRQADHLGHRLRPETGRPNYIEEGRPGDPSGSADGKKGKVVFSAPSFLGGKNQQQMAYNPQTGLFYVPANEWGMDIWNEPVSYKRVRPTWAPASPSRPCTTTTSAPCAPWTRPPARSSGKTRTTLPVGRRPDHRRQPDLLRYPEGYLKALDAKTGKEVWSFQTGSGVVAPPVTWGRRRAVRRRGVRLGRRCSPVGRRRGPSRELPGAGRFRVGVQAAQQQVIALAGCGPVFRAVPAETPLYCCG
jgi:alcohol dehydrogenase (cytochrome c)